MEIHGISAEVKFLKILKGELLQAEALKKVKQNMLHDWLILCCRNTIYLLLTLLVAPISA
jgi:hypothetical protein